MTMNLDALFQATAACWPQQPAVIDEAGAGRLSYAELDARIERASKRLREAGVAPRQFIGLHLDSGLDHIVLTYALWRLRACVVPMALEASRDEKRRIVDEIALDGVLSTRVGLSELPAALQAGFEALSDGHGLVRPARRTPHPPHYEDVDAAFLRFSSGTTGVAKGVMLSHQTILERIVAANEVLCIGPGDTVLWLLSMAYHFAVTIVSYLSHGATIVLCHNQQGAALVRQVQREQASVIYGAPIHFERMIQDSPRPQPLSSVRLAIATTAPGRPQLAERFRQCFGVPVNRALGLIEVGLPCIDLEPSTRREGSIGRLLPAYSIRLRPLAPGAEHKEILLAGPGLFDAYYRPFVKREQAAPEGWFATGDLGEVDADGHVYLVGRIKEVINVGGLKIFPAEIEHVLNAHPAVEESCVFACAHPVLGEVPHARVVLSAAGRAQGIDGAALAAHCAQRLAGAATPAEIALVVALPRTPSGKLIRRALAQ